MVGKDFIERVMEHSAMKRLVAACGVVVGSMGLMAVGQQVPLQAATPENAVSQGLKRPTAAQLEQWLAELDSDDFALRVQASDRLLAAGESALEALAGAINDKRPEVAWRAGEVLRQIASSGDEESAARVESALSKLSTDGRPGLAEVAAEIRSRHERRRHDRAAAALIALGGKLSHNGEPDGLFAGEMVMLPPMIMAADFGFVAPGGIPIEEEATIADAAPIPVDEPAGELEAGPAPRLRTLIEGLFEAEKPVAAEAGEAIAPVYLPASDPRALEGIALAEPLIPVDAPLPASIDAPPVPVDAPPLPIEALAPIEAPAPPPPAVEPAKAALPVAVLGEGVVKLPADMPAPPPDVVPVVGFGEDLSVVIGGEPTLEVAVGGFIDAAFVGEGAGGVLGAVHDAGGSGLGAESLRLDSSWRGGDEGLATLSDLPSIGIVHIVGAKLTDAALKHVAALPRLQHLHISKTRFSSGALRQFRVAKPDTSLSAPGEAMLGVNADTDRGCVLTNIYPGSGAAAAGLKEGDSLLTVDGQKIGDFTDLMIAVHPHRPGDTIEVEYERDGKKRSARVLLKARSELEK